MFTSYRQGSKADYGITNDNGILTLDQINTGCMLRIADATEAIAKNYLKLQSDLDVSRKLYEQKTVYAKTLEKRNAALRGVITKLKKERQPAIDKKGEE